MSSNEQFQRPLDQISAKEDFEETLPYASKLLIHSTYVNKHPLRFQENKLDVCDEPTQEISSLCFNGDGAWAVE